MSEVEITQADRAMEIAQITMPERGIHVPMREYLERTLASAFRRQPDMSGDQRKRLARWELEAVESAVEELFQAAAAVLTSHRIAAEEGKAELVEVLRREPTARLAQADGEFPQEHWTTKGAIKSARELIKAADALCFAAETSGGTAGRDHHLCAAIANWGSERDKHRQILRIIELEGHSPEIGAGICQAALARVRREG